MNLHECSKCQLWHDNCTCAEDEKVEREEKIIELLKQLLVQLKETNILLNAVWKK